MVAYGGMVESGQKSVAAELRLEELKVEIVVPLPSFLLSRAGRCSAFWADAIASLRSRNATPVAASALSWARRCSSRVSAAAMRGWVCRRFLFRPLAPWNCWSCRTAGADLGIHPAAPERIARMPTPIYTPRINNNDDTVRLAAVLVEDRPRQIRTGDPIIDVETDKAPFTVESTMDGYLLAVNGVEGDTMEVGSILAWIGATPTNPLPRCAAPSTPRSPAPGLR